MATHVSVGTSTNRSEDVAAREVGDALISTGWERVPDLVMVHATACYDQKALVRGISVAVGGATLVGCSCEGTISAASSCEQDHAVAGVAIWSDDARFHVTLDRDYSHEPAEAGRRLARWVNGLDESAQRVLLVFPDGLAGNATQMLDAAFGELASAIPIVGGAAADAMTMSQTFQYRDTEVVSGGLAAVLVAGEVDAEIAVSHGCVPVGLERELTEADGGWMRTIDGQPAWPVFKEYLDGDPEDLNADGAVHLAIGEPMPTDEVAGYDQFIIHTPLALDRETGSLFFPGGDLESGTRIRLMRRAHDRIKESAQSCAEQISRTHGGRIPLLVLQYDCAGRGRALFGNSASEAIVEPLQRVLGDDVPWLGFHTYGEIAPIHGRPRYHNYTVALCALYAAEHR